MQIDLTPPKYAQTIRSRVLTKPTAELEMMIRRWEEDDYFWAYVYAREELATRKAMESKRTGVMFFKEDPAPSEDFIIRFGAE